MKEHSRAGLSSLFQSDYFDHHTTCLAIAGKSAIGGTVVGGVYGVSQNFWFGYGGHPALTNFFRHSAFGALFAGLYFGSACSLANLRNKDDGLNAAFGGLVTGLAYGIKKRLVVNMVAFSTLGVLTATTAYYVMKEINDNKNIPYSERAWKEWSTFTRWKRPDPFVRRYEELKEKGVSGAQ